MSIFTRFNVIPNLYDFVSLKLDVLKNFQAALFYTAISCFLQCTTENRRIFILFPLNPKNLFPTYISFSTFERFIGCSRFFTEPSMPIEPLFLIVYSDQNLLCTMF